MPHTCPASTYDSFMDIRAQVAIAKDNLLPIDADNQVCSKFGLHPDFPDIQSLYDEKDLMFFANTGVMTRVRQAALTYHDNFFKQCYSIPISPAQLF